MDFFAAQDDARRRTRRLIWLFAGAVAGMIGGIYLALIAFLGDSPSWWDPEFFAWTAGLTLLLVGGASTIKILSLKSGGKIVAESVGGRRIDAGTSDPDERRLLNLVEEMAIASGVTVPSVYLLPDEEMINAFAAGFTPSDAAVAFTKGCMQRLSRDELQGVVAHEFSHILNGDMRLNIHLIGVLFGILVLSIVGQGLLRSALYSSVGGARRSKDGNGLVVALIAGGVILLVAGSIGVFFGRLIQSAVSRQREFLADAAAVQFTRNPAGLSGALQKIGGMGSRVENPHSQDVAHLFFANGLRSSFGGWFATHPPLGERVRAIDPSWEGSFAAVEESERSGEASSSLAGEAMVASLAGSGGLVRARKIRHSLADRCGPALQDPMQARALVFALLVMDSLPSAQAGQLGYLRESGGAALEEAVGLRMSGLQGLPEDERLPLLEVVLPVLSRLDAAERPLFLERLQRVVLADGQITFFAFVAGWLIRRHLTPPERLRPIGRPEDLAHSLGILLGSLATLDAADEEAKRTFSQGLAASEVFRRLVAYPELSLPDYEQLGEALSLLAAATFALRQEILAMASAVVWADGQISQAEESMLRFIASALECPSPLPGLPATE